MGYLNNVLPKYLARLGADVHVITEDLTPYYQASGFQTNGTCRRIQPTSSLRPGTVERIDGFTLHVLGHRRVLGYMRAQGLFQKLKEIRPNVVQTMVAIGWLALDAAIFKPVLGYKLFTGNHTAASCYQPARNGFSTQREHILSTLTRFAPGRFASLMTSKCYAVTSDCAEIAWRFFGVQPAKVEVMHLGVDTEVFHAPAPSEFGERETVRKALGFTENTIICIYTGKLNDEKDPLILARAVEQLRRGNKKYAALFIGDGNQAPVLAATHGCKVVPSMPFRDLVRYYRAADIGVWPTYESISMLDAAACGLPLIISDCVTYREHVEGNGLVFRLNDLGGLISTLLQLEDEKERRRLGNFGAEKMKLHWSWESRARARLADYERALKY
jgi:glycosyltransferase involved in cell wall biosynthesis